MTTEQEHIDVDDILEGASRALFLSAYANAAEEEGSDLPAAGPGEDWDDVAPDTPEAAKDSARSLLNRVGELHWERSAEPGQRTADNADSILQRPCADWIRAGGDGGRSWTAEEHFGHCLAMQALGYGVGLIDDVRPDADYTSPDLPNWESNYIGGDFYAT